MNIRKAVFETNSSSTHALVISPKSKLGHKFDEEMLKTYEKKGFVPIYFKKFGWDLEIYDDTPSKIAYLVQLGLPFDSLSENYETLVKDFFVKEHEVTRENAPEINLHQLNWLDERGYHFSSDVLELAGRFRIPFVICEGGDFYIDHQSKEKFVNKITKNEKYYFLKNDFELWSFIADTQNYLITCNDNEFIIVKEKDRKKFSKELKYYNYYTIATDVKGKLYFVHYTVALPKKVNPEKYKTEVIYIPRGAKLLYGK